MQSKPKRWREVTMPELERIWGVFNKQGVLWNGCTDFALRTIYGSTNVMHRMGYGWYKLTSGADATWKDADLTRVLRSPHIT